MNPNDPPISVDPNTLLQSTDGASSLNCNPSKKLLFSLLCLLYDSADFL